MTPQANYAIALGVLLFVHITIAGESHCCGNCLAQAASVAWPPFVQYVTRLLIKSTMKGVAFSFLFPAWPSTWPQEAAASTQTLNEKQCWLTLACELVVLRQLSRRCCQCSLAGHLHSGSCCANTKSH